MLSPSTNFARAKAEPLSVLEIHLDRIRRNYLAVQKTLSRGTDCAAVVKADAYGLGATMVVPELYKAGCRHFYVAYAGEGMAARAALAGEDAHIYVLHGPHGAEPEEFVARGLTPVLNTPEDISGWAAFARTTGRKQPALIHIDTGMNRLGLSAADVEKLAKNPDVLKPLDVRYVMSHLACADTPEHPKNREQLEKFRRLSGLLKLPCRLSLANSAGVFLGPDYHFDQARPGCALYGMNPQGRGENPMQGVVTLKARILQIRDVAAGETVGYGATYQVAKAAKLATISAGYADGYLRSLTAGARAPESNTAAERGGGTVYVGGRKCPVVGRVSMDAIVVDVSSVPSVSAGGWAEIIGAHQGVDAVAVEAGTIGYEILTALGKRYARVYSGRE